jgi:hypothetical protein
VTCGFVVARGGVEPPTFRFSDVEIHAGQRAANAHRAITRAITKLQEDLGSLSALPSKARSDSALAISRSRPSMAWMYIDRKDCVIVPRDLEGVDQPGRGVQRREVMGRALVMPWSPPGTEDRVATRLYGIPGSERMSTHPIQSSKTDIGIAGHGIG